MGNNFNFDTEQVYEGCDLSYSRMNLCMKLLPCLSCSTHNLFTSIGAGGGN